MARARSAGAAEAVGLPGPARRALLALAIAGAAAAAEPPIFVDATAASGLDFVHFNGMTGQFYFVENMGAGAALLDYDRDGDLDLYLLQGHLLGEGSSLADATLPAPHPPPFLDRLLRNDPVWQAGGDRGIRFVDVTRAAGIEAPGYGMGAATADYDGDGDVDLYLTNFGPNQLLQNQGDGTFRDVTDAAGVGERRWSVPATFFDLDHDGLLDLYVGNYVQFDLADNRYCPDFSGGREGRDYCGALSFAPETDRLFRNRGDGTFEDVTTRFGLHRRPARTLGAVTADFDGDGRIDLYVANDMDANQLWMNRPGSLEDEAALAGAALNWEGQPEAGMGVDAADDDGDGDPDLFVTHLLGQTNTLYRNDGRGLFRDETLAAGLGPASWRQTGFGAGFLDLELDGDLDLVVANGSVEVLDELARAGDPYPLHQANQLFRNLGQGRYEEATADGGEAFRRSEVSRAATLGDLDDDGDVDLVITNNAGPARLLLNRAGDGGGWVGFRTLDAAGADLAGAQIWLLRPGAPPVLRQTRTDGGYLSAHDPRVSAGLGAAPAPAAARIVWPGGRIQEIVGPPVGRYLVVLLPADTSEP